MLQQLYRVIDRVGAMWTIIAATLSIVLGVLIVVYPLLLAWLLGVLLVLGGLAVFAVLLGVAGARIIESPPVEPDDALRQHHTP